MRDGFLRYADEGIDLRVISTKADEGSSGFGATASGLAIVDVAIA